MILGCFIWERGSINDNIRKILKENGIKFRYYYTTLVVDAYKLDLWQKVKHVLVDPIAERYVVYVDDYFTADFVK